MKEIEKRRKYRQDHKPQFVYFDDDKNIVAMCGYIMDSEYPNSHRAVFPLKDVREFIVGKKNINSYRLIQDIENPSGFSIEKKHLAIGNVKVIDRFVTEIKEQQPNDFQLVIHNKIKDRQLVIHIEQSLRKHMLQYTTYDADNISLEGIPQLNFYFTLRGDPSFLITSICINTSNLLSEERIYVDYKQDLSNASLYAKKIFNTYFYKVDNE